MPSLPPAAESERDAYRQESYDDRRYRDQDAGRSSRSYREPSPRKRGSEPYVPLREERDRSASPPRRRKSRSPDGRYDDYNRGSYGGRGGDRDYGRGGERGDYGRGGGERRSGPPPERRIRRPVERGTEEERSRSTQLFMGNLPYSYDERDVRDLAEKFGRVMDCTLPMDRFTGKNKGFCFINFEDRRDAEDFYNEMNRNGELNGRRVKIDWDVGKDKKGGSAPPRGGDRPEFSSRGSRYDD
ncbi:hypothetical protein HDU97_006921 [Phlyctochytrium planicorne]|nr:hypothetical protein HDU97_006921 [Phlyctochytrium planicorne]